MKEITKTFQIENFLSDEERASIEKEEKQEEAIKKKEDKRREIRITEIGKASVSEIMCGALREALFKEDLEFVEIESSDEDILKDVRFVSNESINTDLGMSTRFAREADVVILEGGPVTTRQEQIFRNNLSEHPNVYRNMDEFVKSQDFVEVTEFEDDPPGVSLEDDGFFTAGTFQKLVDAQNTTSMESTSDHLRTHSYFGVSMPTIKDEYLGNVGDVFDIHVDDTLAKFVVVYRDEHLCMLKTIEDGDVRFINLVVPLTQGV